MRVVHDPSELTPVARTVAVGSFDGVHRGHRSVLRTVVETGLEPIVVTFDPHPRIALGNKVELLTTLERRLELLAEAGIETALVATFDSEFQRLSPEAFAERFLRAVGVECVVAGEDFRFGVRRSGDLSLLERLGFDVVVPAEVDGVSSTAIRAALAEGDVVGTLGYPTANLRLGSDLACPRYGIYAGSARGHRAAVSIGTNPHYGGSERRIEPYLLDYGGDLYDQRLVVELWQRLRDESVFESEEALVQQIARDVEATRAARRPVDAD